MTKGEYRVGINFNPSADDLVAQIKRQAADLIDLIDTISIPAVSDGCSATHSNEVARLRALAQTAIEEAAMWAVKSATKPELERV
jgi:hypothetical protein